METKRFIGNDMPRIYARIRNAFGPDAVIMETRSLLREGAEPLIEVIAAPPDYEQPLPLDLQRSLIDGALGRVQSPPRAVTVGDLEDIAQREASEERDLAERRERYIAALEAVEEQPNAPAWLQGFVANAPARPETPTAASDSSAGLREVGVEADSAASTATGALPFRSLPDLPAEPPPSDDWARRPRPSIVSRRPPTEPPPGNASSAAAASPSRQRRMPSGGRRPGSIAESLADELRDAGLSEAAAALVAEAGYGGPAVDCLTRLLGSRPVAYPDDTRTAVLSIQGAAGSGRTTALMRMALDCADSGREAILVAADGSHVAGREQVHAYGEAIGLPVVDVFDLQQMRSAALKAPRGACLFVDVPAGPWQEPSVPGIGQSAYLAIPAHWHASALSAALTSLLERPVPGQFAGAILTFADISTELSPALSFVVTSLLGVAFLSSGRDVSAGIGLADPGVLASGVFTTRSRESTDGRLVATA